MSNLLPLTIRGGRRLFARVAISQEKKRTTRVDDEGTLNELLMRCAEMQRLWASERQSV
jgi:hypothetical protein